MNDDAAMSTKVFDSLTDLPGGCTIVLRCLDCNREKQVTVTFLTAAGIPSNTNPFDVQAGAMRAKKPLVCHRCKGRDILSRPTMQWLGPR
ncbi:hypothetical protein [Nitrospirillum sp. BR 11163]|uniref:hypothetical protein n=1 Tax=Nitrospirillum sp. BR 11163 TaxID=3104323 RepID=UPI002AFFBCD3|nr:hypothetical protein [Nitrospirillum sp. BR 11163]MEA1674121.1 hypothetical protein [Nitrospirillum sp. BR 11163]